MYPIYVKKIREKASAMKASGSPSYEKYCRDHADILLPKPKKNWNCKAQSIWGDLRVKAGRARFKEYLKNLKNADGFLEKKKSILFLRQLPNEIRGRIYRRLREVDMEGYKKVKHNVASFSQGVANRTKKKLAKVADVRHDMVMVEQKMDAAASPSIIKLMPIGGLRNVLALCVASGYTRDQVAAMVQMDVTEMNALVTEEDVKAAALDMPRAITHLANGIVMRDLMNGVVTAMTKDADMIAHRRTKVAVDVSQESRKRSKFDDEILAKKEESIVTRFGVDRQKGEAVNADSKS